jgi:CRP-like cAMP-binding protein
MMSNTADASVTEPIRDLASGDTLVAEGASGGDLHVLLSGALSVERGGVTLATLTLPGTLVGEMSVLLGTPASATVRAAGPARVRTIANAAAVLEADPRLAMRVAATVARRLDATSALLVELSHQHADKPSEQTLLSRIMGALHVMGDGVSEVERRDLFGVEDWARLT